MIALLVALAVGSGREPTATLCAVGDVTLARGIARRIERDGSPLVGVADELRRADIRFCNLECALSARDTVPARHVVLRAVPSAAKWLSGQFDVASISNNHSLDCGVAGWRDTSAALRRAGVQPVGDGAHVVVVSTKGIRIGFVAMTDFPPPAPIPADPLCYLSEIALRRAVERARKVAEVVVVSIHWGIELSPFASQRQVALATVAAQAGADVVIGSHPHVLQPVAWISSTRGRTLVAYSMGNFVFDASRLGQSRSAILLCKLDRYGVRSAEEIPVQVSGGYPKVAGRPRTFQNP